MTHPPTLIPDLRFTAVNSAFGFRTPKVPGEPIRVQHRGEGAQARGSSIVHFLRPAPRRRRPGLPSPGEAGPSGHTVNFTP